VSGDVIAEKYYYWGVDCGSTEIKVVLLDSAGSLLCKRRVRTLFPLVEHVKKALAMEGRFPSPFEGDGETVKANHKITVTGYGRTHIPFIQERLTEIKAHFIGVERQLASELKMIKAYTLIDIGGQDSKITTVKDKHVEQFVINRKCAAGTGAFIEELAHRLELKIEDLTELSQKHDKKVMLNSYCTVFAGQEVIRILMNGEKVENLIYSLYQSVVKRVLEMATITTDTLVFSGGVLTYHSVLIDLFKEKFPNKKLLLAPDAQYCGAIGAALFGMGP
jgi:(R)-2-hydroxyacyl-CoA dehydratese activating ATPase